MEPYERFIDRIINKKSNFKIGINKELLNKELSKKHNEYIEKKDEYSNAMDSKLSKLRKELVAIAIDSDSFSSKLKHYLDNKYLYYPTTRENTYNRYSRYELITDIILIKDDQAMIRNLLKKLNKNNSCLNKIRIGELERELKELDRRLTNIRKSYGSDYISYIIERSREVSK